MGQAHKISDAIVKRLPAYYRYLGDLQTQGITRISSKELGARMGLTASQIRQDINCFGGFGQQGYGYHVAELKACIGDVLGLVRTYNMVVLGAGHMGQAVAQYDGFRHHGFCTTALFDPDTNLIGTKIAGLPVYSPQELSHYCRENTVNIGIIATPMHAAQTSCDALIACGVYAIWNFAPVDLVTPDSVAVSNVHLSDTLLVLAYHMQKNLHAELE